MTIGSETAWARGHKDRLVGAILADYPLAVSDERSAIFMAGLPGAGKTEFANGLLQILQPGSMVRLDMDEIATKIEGYTPREADRFRSGASIILARAIDEVLRQKMNFLLDGTFGHKRAIENVQRALGMVYAVKIFYVVQDPRVAWNFTKQREKIEHRAISLEGFVNAFFNTPRNIFDLMSQKYDKMGVTIIRKDNTNAEVGRQENINLQMMGEFIRTEIKQYDKDSLRRYIND